MSMHWRKYKLLMLKGSKGRVCFGKGGCKLCHRNKISEISMHQSTRSIRSKTPKTVSSPKPNASNRIIEAVQKYLHKALPKGFQLWKVLKLGPKS